MIKITLKQLILSKKKADSKLAVMDVEHAYYSSVLEGSKLDKKDFEQLAQVVQ